ncbi:MAG: hypothetical protein MRT15_03800 [archaeon YNP-LCB-003-016]|uniref:hypothetical protein n=1 Tax=Candidatus Culexarchaeum yellowstonense TaxID=2928963 RepID=UPI0026EB79C7|nr:hypothetical protein [Candidatus Culexarchaeum yellowstonense]MCR6691491.1 hypothetical protein [Candidatus Culexarchaeum yellowstonense]
MSEEDKEREKLKSLLKEKIDQLSKEVEILKMCLEILSEKPTAAQQKLSETKVEVKVEKPVQKAKTPERKLLTSISEGGENIANIYVEEDKIIVVPGKNVKVDVNSRDFKDFFVKKVLFGLKKEKPSISYEVKDVNGTLKEVIIKNVTEERDVKRIEGAVKWTFSRFISKP